jgi:hypothetical protein
MYGDGLHEPGQTKARKVKSIWRGNMRQLIVIALIFLTSHAIIGCQDNSIAPDSRQDYSNAAQSPAPNDIVVLQGFFMIRESGCYILETQGARDCELQFGEKAPAPKFPSGAYVEVRGRYALVTGSPCMVGPIVIVESIIQIPENKR